MVEGLEKRYKNVKGRIHDNIGQSMFVQYKDGHPINARLKMHLLDPVFKLWNDPSFLAKDFSHLSAVSVGFRSDLNVFMCHYWASGHQSADLNRLELFQVGLLLETALSEKDKVGGLDELEPGELEKSEREQLNKLSKQVKDAIRTRVATMLTSMFSDDSANYRSSAAQDLYAAEWRFFLSPEGFALSCPVGVWVDYKLAELWRKNLALQACKQCGAIFAPTHGSALYCKGGGCADKALNVKKRVGKALAK